jgi:hypothetical protein
MEVVVRIIKKKFGPWFEIQKERLKNYWLQ